MTRIALWTLANDVEGSPLTHLREHSELQIALLDALLARQRSDATWPASTMARRATLGRPWLDWSASRMCLT